MVNKKIWYHTVIARSETCAFIAGAIALVAVLISWLMIESIWAMVKTLIIHYYLFRTAGLASLIISWKTKGAEVRLAIKTRIINYDLIWSTGYAV
jgi:hypothetical protein